MSIASFLKFLLFYFYTQWYFVMDSLSNQIRSFESIEIEFGDLNSSDDGSWEEICFLKAPLQSDAGDLYKLREMKDALNDNAAVRYLAANSLKALDCEGVVDALLFALTDSYEWIRIGAIEGLGDRRALKLLSPSFNI